MEKITWIDFEKIELRVGTILEVLDFPEAKKPAYILKVDFGEDIGVKTSSAQVKDLYSSESLVGKQIIGVINFGPKQIGPVTSECLVTGFYNKNGAVVLAVPDSSIRNGAKLL